MLLGGVAVRQWRCTSGADACGVTDRSAPYTPPPPPTGIFVYDETAMTIGSPEHLALVADATGANGPLQKGTVTFNNTPDLTCEAFIIDPPGYESVPMPMGGAIVCALGRKFRVELTDDTRWFHTWSAPDTLIDGGSGTSETFVLGNPSQQGGALCACQLAEGADLPAIGLSVATGRYKPLASSKKAAHVLHTGNSPGYLMNSTCPSMNKTFPPPGTWL